MTVIPVLHHPAGWLGLLGESALRSLAAAGFIGLMVTLLPWKRAAVRLRIWSGVLYVALAMPLLGAFLPRVNVPIPPIDWIPVQRTHPASVPVSSSAPTGVRVQPAVPGHEAPSDTSVRFPAHFEHPHGHATAGTPDSNAAAHSPAPQKLRSTVVAWFTHLRWTAIAAAVYLLGFLILLIRLLLGIRGSMQLSRTAEPISPRYFPRKDEVDDVCISAALELLNLQSQRAGLQIAPRLKESAALLVPATVGIRKPVVLLPEDWRRWSGEKLQAVLSHEISHVARRDALTQLFSLIHRALFWFSPLAWWLDRQIAELAEQASDEAALAGGANRTIYAETLLAFFAQLESVSGRVRWHALSMASHGSSGHAERRVDRILAWKGSTSMKKSLIIVFAGCAAPVIFLVASLHPFVTAQAQVQLKDSPGPAANPAIKPISSASVVSSPSGPLLVAQAAPAGGEKSIQQEEAKSSSDSTTINIHGGSYNFGSGPRYVFMQGNSNNVTMSGDDEDLEHARRLRGKISGDFMWFQRDEKSYVITDPAFLARVKGLFAPQEQLARQQDELGRQQDELGRQQDALGRQQDEVGKQMDAISVKVPDISPELERIHAQLKELQASGATQRELGRLQSQIGQLQSRLARLQSEAGEQQSMAGRHQGELGRQQGELGRKQGELGRQQGELGRQQGELARKASHELRGMFDDAITKGIAKPE